MKTKVKGIDACIVVFFITIVVCASNVFAQEKKSVDPEITKKIEEAKKNTKKQMKESQELIRKLIEQKKNAKTDEEKIAFQKKMKALLQEQNQKIPNLKWQLKLANFHRLYYALLSESKIKNGKRILPEIIDTISTKTQIDVNSIHYFGNLDRKSKNTKEVILLYEKKPDMQGRRIILFLDGHIEVSAEMN